MARLENQVNMLEQSKNSQNYVRRGQESSALVKRNNPSLIHNFNKGRKEVNDQIQETKRLATDVRGQAAQYRRVSSQQ